VSVGFLLVWQDGVIFRSADVLVKPNQALAELAGLNLARTGVDVNVATKAVEVER
jgi:hypothetical protein